MSVVPKALPEVSDDDPLVEANLKALHAIKEARIATCKKDLDEAKNTLVKASNVRLEFCVSG